MQGWIQGFIVPVHVFFISDLFLPDDVLAFEITGNDEVRHRSVGCGAVPVIDVAWLSDLRALTLSLMICLQSANSNMASNSP